MITELLNTQIKQILQQKVHSSISTLSFSSVAGGSINDTYKITVPGNRSFFLKLNSEQKFPSLFEKEKNGLQFIAEKKIIRTPAVIDCAVINDQQILILEWIEQGLKSPSFWKLFGEKLASLHHITNDYFGFTENNYMGALPQSNNPTSAWSSFFIQHRLQPQVQLAERNGLVESKHVSQFEKLYEKMDLVFDNEKPSLLHGDLWSGNFLCDEHSQPVLIDPAVYFGHRCMDLGMTTLFGGFDKSFYDAYHYHFSLPAKYLEQWDVCNLYPLLIHLNLFGGSYLHDIAAILRKFTA
jgi:protein-ribulosamine 3-kinase